MLYVQRVTQQEIRLKKKEEQRGTGDLFGCDESLEATIGKNNKFQAKHYLEDKLSESELTIKTETETKPSAKINTCSP